MEHRDLAMMPCTLGGQDDYWRWHGIHLLEDQGVELQLFVQFMRGKQEIRVKLTYDTHVCGSSGGTFVQLDTYLLFKSFFGSFNAMFILNPFLGMMIQSGPSDLPPKESMRSMAPAIFKVE